MKKIGFIDYFLDNYHAKNYPKWINEYSNGEMKVVCAYALSDQTNGKMTNSQWSEQFEIPLVSSPEEVIAQCDCVMILSPSNPQMHEKLCFSAVQSGKRVYVDKAFSDNLDSAKRIFDLADKTGTPCCSSSSLAFVPAFENIRKDGIVEISSKGPGSFDVYAIHQFEPVIATMKCKPARVMCTGSKTFPSFIIEFEDGRYAKTEQYDSAEFEMYVGYSDGTSEFIKAEEDVFKGFILRLIEYFKTGNLVAGHIQTLSVIALLDAAKVALDLPFEWITIEKF